MNAVLVLAGITIGWTCKDAGSRMAADARLTTIVIAAPSAPPERSVPQSSRENERLPDAVRAPSLESDRVSRSVLCGGVPPPEPAFIDLNGIRRLSARRFEIAHDTRNAVLRNLSAFGRCARFALETINGKPNGIRVAAIATNSIVAQLGLRDDDLLVSVNGRDLTNQDAALEAYAGLKAAHTVILEVRRGGLVMYINYDIV